MAPSSSEKRVLRRARPVHSCIPCRNKKLKCDRNAPCQMCVKADRVADCFYDAHAGSLSRLSENANAASDGESEHRQRPARVARLENTDDVAGASATSLVHPRMGVVEDLQRRVEKLEALAGASTGAARSFDVAFQEPGSEQQEHHPDALKDADPHIPGTVEFKDGRSKFRPVGHKSAILYRFLDAKAFIGNKVNDPTVIKKLRSLRRHFPKPSQPHTLTYRQTANQMIKPRIYELIPPKRECDALLPIYFEGFQIILFILDRSSFNSQYDAFWRLPVDQRIMSPFSPCLLLVAYLASFTLGAVTPTGLQVPTELVDDWLHGRISRDLSDLLTIQIELLLICAMQMSGVIIEQVYRVTGRVVRSSLICGLQYDPGSVSQIPKVEVDMRRGIFHSVVELDLAASQLCGLPCASGPEEFSCHAITNANRLMATLHETLPLRLEGARLVKHRVGDRARAAQVVEVLEKAQSADNREDNVYVAKAIFDIWCHRSILSSARLLLEGPALSPGRLASCRSSLRILDHLEQLTSVPEQWTLYFCCAHQDIFQSILMVCLVLRVRNIEASKSPAHRTSSRAASTPGSTDKPDVAQTPFDAAELGAIARRSLDILLSHISREQLGTYLKDLLVLSVAIDSAHHPLDPTAQQAAMDRGFTYVIERLHERGRRAQSGGAAPVALSRDPTVSAAPFEAADRLMSGMAPLMTAGGSSSDDTSSRGSGAPPGPMDAMFDYDGASWLTGGTFNMDFGLPLEQNFGMEDGFFNTDGMMNWAAF